MNKNLFFLFDESNSYEAVDFYTRFASVICAPRLYNLQKKCETLFVFIHNIASEYKHIATFIKQCKVN